MDYKSKTNTFGKDAEHYLAGLYSMDINLNKEELHLLKKLSVWKK
jgi:hypothetical protein